MPGAGDFAVQTRRLSKSYPLGNESLQVLRGVDLDVRRGEFVSIMGPSGSGKSTLLNLVGLLDVPTEGALRLLGTETHAMSGRQRAVMRRQALGFVFQSFNLMPRLDALRNVMLPMAIAGVPLRERRRKARDLLASVGLADRTGHLPGELSGGQKQRVAIARALALDPPILLADEPTGNLDSKTSLEVMDLFVKLNAAGKTILQVTHDEAMAEYGTRVVRFRDGRIVAEEARALMSFEEPSFFLAPPRPRDALAAEGPAAPARAERRVKEGGTQRTGSARRTPSKTPGRATPAKPPEKGRA